MDKFISELKNGDNEAYLRLIEMYSRRLYYFCLKLLGSSADAEDAVQTTFFKVYNGINRFEERSGLTTWIYKIAYNTCNDILRKRKNEYVFEKSDDIYLTVADEGASVEDEVVRREREKIVYECIYRLSSSHRRFIVLRDLEGLSYAKIADMLDLNMGTVKSGISRAREKLLKLVREYER